jgi:hypothetical protein
MESQGVLMPTQNILWSIYSYHDHRNRRARANFSIWRILTWPNWASLQTVSQFILHFPPETSLLPAQRKGCPTLLMLVTQPGGTVRGLIKVEDILRGEKGFAKPPMTSHGVMFFPSYVTRFPLILSSTRWKSSRFSS